MSKIIWQYDPDRRRPEVATAEHARRRLEAGNRAFASLPERLESETAQVVDLSAADLGLAEEPGRAPAQTPFAVVLGCADARVPVELIFGQATNDVFVVRVAGNVLGDVCIGSIEYALGHLPSVRQVVVLGHTGCGAVSAAVAGYLRPLGYLEMAASPALRSVVDSLNAVVHTADRVLQRVHGPAAAERPGYRAALADLASCLNAAMEAHLLRQWFAAQLGAQLGISYGVYNLVTRQVGLPAADGDALWTGRLADPPADDAAFSALAETLARAAWIERLLSQ